MDWKLFLTAFGTLFIAEFGDKTQLAAFTLTSSSQKPWTVFIASSLALMAVTAIGVLVGQAAGKFIPETILKKGAALLFIAIGVWTWFKG